MIGVQDISAFYFEWPWALALLLLIPVGWALYMRQLRRRLHQIALHFSYTAVVEQIRQQPPLWKRLLLPGACSLLSACLVIALARPTVVGRVPVNSVDMMIVMDISLSMLAEDIRPDRITAAKACPAMCGWVWKYSPVIITCYRPPPADTTKWKRIYAPYAGKI
jgi:Ca-activated chloride channel family protein